MSTLAAKPIPPSTDKRWKLIDATMRRLGYDSHALIEALHAVQETFGYLDEPAMRYVAESLNVPVSKVYGVATFYHFFSLKPKGKHNCVVCMGTACYIKGAPALLAAIEQRHGVKPGETTKDNLLSVLTARCVGSCGLAPAVVFDGNVSGKLDRSEVLSRIEELIKK